MLRDANVREDRNAPELWTFVWIESWALPKIAFLIALASAVMVVFHKGAFWYHPILPIVMYFLTRLANKRFQESALAATLFSHEKEYSAKSKDPDRILDIMRDMRMKAEAVVGGLPFVELFALPPTVRAWTFFLLIRLLTLGQIIVLTLWAVLNSFSFVQFLAIIFVCWAPCYLLQRANANYLFILALERWTSWHLACIDSVPEIRSTMQLISETDETAFPDWLKMEITRLYRLGVHPDYFRFSKDHHSTLGRAGHLQMK